MKTACEIDIALNGPHTHLYNVAFKTGLADGWQGLHWQIVPRSDLMNNLTARGMLRLNMKLSHFKQMNIVVPFHIINSCFPSPYKTSLGILLDSMDLL